MGYVYDEKERLLQIHHLMNELEEPEYSPLRKEWEQYRITDHMIEYVVLKSQYIEWTPAEILSELNEQIKEKHRQKWENRVDAIPYKKGVRA